ncbi:MAG: sugar phosphate isomerase/epimerase family protein [Armatimonadota bacterium]
MGMPKVGCQLIVFGERNRTDLPGVLRDVAAAGFAGVETGNLSRHMTIEQAKNLLSSNGLELCGVHSGYGDFEKMETVDSHIQFLKAMGARYLMCSGVAPGEGIEPYEKSAVVFNEVGRRCKDAGVVFCYHNHNWEFQEFGGVKGIHRLAELTDPELVKLCVDVYWVTVGGESPVEFIQRYRDRAAYFHLKDLKDGTFTELGSGIIDFPAIMDVVRTLDVEWVVYEQDRSSLPPEQAVAISRKYLKEKLGL